MKGVCMKDIFARELKGHNILAVERFLQIPAHLTTHSAKS